MRYIAPPSCIGLLSLLYARKGVFEDRLVAPENAARVPETCHKAA